MFGIKETIICPVSQEPFTHAKVLPCGHTFDAKSLLSVSHCPLCRKRFQKTRVATNWILMEALNLDVPPESKTNAATFNDYTKADALKDTDDTVTERCMQRYLPRILKAIQKQARNGESSCEYQMFWKGFTKPVADLLVENLRARGFQTKTNYRVDCCCPSFTYDITILWNNRRGGIT